MQSNDSHENGTVSTAPTGADRGMRWYRRARVLGFAALAVLTVYSIREFVTGDWEAVADYWRGKLSLLPLILGLTALDMLLEGISWSWVYERFGFRARDRVGAGVFLSGNAGLLLPAQMGRLIRPDAMVRLGRGSLAECCKAEAAVFVLDATSVVALLAGLGAWVIHPALALIAAAGVIGVSLFLGDRIAERLTGTRLDMPVRFWWSWQSVATVFIQMVGWAAHGISFYILVSDLPGSVGVWDAMFFAPATAVLGIGSGLPGGVGATEGLLGAFLRFNQVPAAHLGLAVGAFRVVTFWIRIPIGWTALAVTRRRSVSVAEEPGGRSVAPEGAPCDARSSPFEPAGALGTISSQPRPEGLSAHVDGS